MNLIYDTQFYACGKEIIPRCPKVNYSRPEGRMKRQKG